MVETEENVNVNSNIRKQFVLSTGLGHCPGDDTLHRHIAHKCNTTVTAKCGTV